VASRSYLHIKRLIRHNLAQCQDNLYGTAAAAASVDPQSPCFRLVDPLFFEKWGRVLPHCKVHGGKMGGLAKALANSVVASVTVIRRLGPARVQMHFVRSSRLSRVRSTFTT